MKNKLIFPFFLLLLTFRLHAHSVWIETSAKGETGKSQTVKVFFGEYGKNKREKVGKRFTEVDGFTAWAVSPSGKQTFLKFAPKENSFESAFTPAENGTYVILLENKVRDVAAWRNTSGKLGIIKQNYYARATVQVGTDMKISDKAFTDLVIAKIANKQENQQVSLQVMFQGKPVAGTSLVVRAPDLEEIKLTTDQEGKVIFKDAKAGIYTVTALLRFETPGTFKGVYYEAIREKGTFTLTVD